MKEIDWRLRAITSRWNEERKFQIALHGGESKDGPPELKLDKTQEALIRNAHKARTQNGQRQNNN